MTMTDTDTTTLATPEDVCDALAARGIAGDFNDQHGAVYFDLKVDGLPTFAGAAGTAFGTWGVNIDSYDTGDTVWTYDFPADATAHDIADAIATGAERITG